MFSPHPGDPSSRNIVMFTPRNVLGVNNHFQPFHIPKGANFLFFTLVGAGGGGGGGQIAASAAGGGGGGSGTITRTVIPALALPDVVFVQTGVGGAGGSSNSNGVAGLPSYLSLEPASTTASVIAVAAAGGLGAAAGTAGGGGAAMTATAGGGICLGAWTSLAGQAGSAGAANTLGADLTWGATGLFISGGTAGGGCTNAPNSKAGGAITGLPMGLTDIRTATGDTHYAPSWAFFGSRSTMPFFSTGGLGGQGYGLSTGGAGTDGGPGSGGGGGGGGAGGTGGAGGRGGDGFVLVQWM